MKNKPIYALYKGDTLLEIGTAKEIADSQNMTLKALHHLKAPAYLKRCEKSSKDNYKILIRIEDDEDDKI